LQLGRIISSFRTIFHVSSAPDRCLREQAQARVAGSETMSVLLPPPWRISVHHFGRPRRGARPLLGVHDAPRLRSNGTFTQLGLVRSLPQGPGFHWPSPGPGCSCGSLAEADLLDDLPQGQAPRTIAPQNHASGPDRSSRASWVRLLLFALVSISTHRSHARPGALRWATAARAPAATDMSEVSADHANEGSSTRCPAPPTNVTGHGPR